MAKSNHPGTMMNDNYLNRLRRLRILQVLSRAAPNPMGEIALLSALQVDPELKPTIERVRQSLIYLSNNGLIQLITVENTQWMAGKIYDNGLAFLEHHGTGITFLDENDEPLDIFLPSEKPEADTNGNYRGRVSSVKKLPIEIKAWLDQELVSRNFSGYQQLAALLAEQGYEISKSALGRYGKRFKEQQQKLKQSIEQAKAFAEVIGDDGAAMNQALTALAQDRLMEVIRDGSYDENIKLPALIRSIASLNRSDINTRKFQIEQAARQKALDDAANAVEKAAVQKGMTADQAQFWREQVLGVK